MFRLYFLLLAREKAGIMAQQETFGTEMEDTLVTAMAPQWKYLGHRQQNACGLGRRDTRSVCEHREHVKAVPASVRPKLASGQEPHSRCQTPLKGAGGSPEGPTTWQSPQQGGS